MKKLNHWYPEKIKDIIENEVLPFDRILEVFDELNTKKKVEFICKICNQTKQVRFCYLKRRTYALKEPICCDCILKYVTNTKKWKDKNSKAQYVAQNRPEVLKKQRDAQLKLMRKDKNYAVKRRSGSYLSGRIENIYFDSSWELFYIIYCLDNNIKIRRCKDKIKFVDEKGKTRYFYPDFEVKNKIIEIKGNLTKNEALKIKAGKKKYKNKFSLLKLKDLIKKKIFIKSDSFMREKIFHSNKKYNIVFNENSTLKNLIIRKVIDENKINIKKKI